MKKLFVLFLAGLLCSCETPRSYDPDSPYYSYSGSSLVLNQVLEIPAGWATARLQSGETVAFGSVQEQEPHCIFEINTVRETPQKIQPDRFEIVKVLRETRDFAGVNWMPFIPVAHAHGLDSQPTQLFYRTVFGLRSEKQPEVLRMVCQADRLAPGVGIAQHLTLAETRQALGTIFTFALP